MSTLLVKEFQIIAEEICKLANLHFKTHIYSVEMVEVFCALRDYDDGKGFVLVCTAGLRNASNKDYELRVDIVGAQMEALEELFAKLKAMTETTDFTYDLKFKIKNIKLN